MDITVKDRVLKMAHNILANHSTVRDVAKVVGFSKSTVHKDLKEKLPIIDYELFLEVEALLAYNKKIRHIRGGESTKLHYQLNFPFDKVHSA